MKVCSAIMGTWGVRAFENDDAQDWIYGVADGRDAALVHEALSAAADASYIDAQEGCEALAAAELVAAALGHPCAGPDDATVAADGAGLAGDEARALATVIELAEQLPGLASHADLARRAVAAVGDLERSEVYELWAQDDPPAEWLGAVDDLRQRLSV
jgi:hypothetical protein